MTFRLSFGLTNETSRQKISPVLGAIIVGLISVAAVGQANWRLLTFDRGV
jgi:hypothetical protein